MTPPSAYELRKHLAVHHRLRLTGSNYEALVHIHQMDHQNAPDHDHPEDENGEWS